MRSDFLNAQKRSALYLFISLLIGTTSFTRAYSQEAFDGIYVGYMDLRDGEPRRIPLAVSLILTTESVEVPGGVEYVIDGSCVIDEAGGPYTFIKVSYDFDDNSIDLRYSRPRGDPNSTSPASFRLSGRFTDVNTIEGKVASGLFGNIGSFKIIRDPSRVMLPVNQKYWGRWSGKSQSNVDRRWDNMTVFIGKGISPTTNPQDYEFDFTPGMSGGYLIDDVSIVNFSNVVIDYLRRTIVLHSPTKQITINATMDFEKKTLSGEQHSGMHGLTRTFNLPLVPSNVLKPWLP